MSEIKIAINLLDIPLFKGLEEEDLHSIYQKATWRRVDRGCFFFYQGDPADRIWVLTQGRVKLLQLSPEGQQVIVRVIRPWTLFGGIAMLKERIYPVSAQAAEDSSALVWSREIMMEMVNVYPQLALNAMEMMANHVMEFQERFRELTSERVERRLARALLRLASQLGRKIPEGILIDFPLTRQDMAEMTGTTLYTVSRILSRWESQGLILTHHEHVIVRFPHGLVRIAEDLPQSDGEDE